MNKELKIAVAGEIRSGKDTFCEYIMDEVHGMRKLYFAQGIKDVLEICFPEEMEKGKPRKLYQDVGTFMRTLDPDVWVKHTAREFEWQRMFFDEFIVTDLRQMNEYKWLKANGFTVIKVESDEELRLERMAKSGDVFTRASLDHPVERQIRDLPYDYLVTNNDTLEALYMQADFILDELKKGESRHGTLK